MAIITDERSYDMSGWVSEKANAILSQACAAMDLIREAGTTLSNRDRERIAASLHTIIWDSSKLLAFGYEHLDRWSTEWANLMSRQGSDRYVEFRKRLICEFPDDSPPMKWPLSIQKVLDLFASAEQALEDGYEMGLTRQRVMELGRQLEKITFENMCDAGSELLTLVDKQAADNAISWDTFVEECTDLLQSSYRKFIDAAEERYNGEL